MITLALICLFVYYVVLPVWLGTTINKWKDEGKRQQLEQMRQKQQKK